MKSFRPFFASILAAWLISCAEQSEVDIAALYSDLQAPLSRQEREALCGNFEGLSIEGSSFEASLSGGSIFRGQEGGEPDDSVGQTGLQSFSEIFGPRQKALYLGRKIGDQGEQGELCVKPVVLSNPHLACRQNRCDAHAFCFPPRSIYRDQRALFVAPCERIDFNAGGDLLTQGKEEGWGSIAFFQAFQLGGDLIQQREQDGEYFLEFPTDASVGHLYWRNAGYGWAETIP